MTNCRRCGIPVRADAEVFEGMHFICFHYVVEHEGDPDEVCLTGRACPSASRLTGGRAKASAMAEELSNEIASGAPWDNDTLWSYLEAFATRLRQADARYHERDTYVPGDGWNIVVDALRAATHEESPTLGPSTR